MSKPTFAMICCAHGAEKAVKQSIGKDGWRLAFSRPGFVTAKNDEQTDLPQGIFVRTASHSIGSAKSTSSSENIQQLISKLTNAGYAEKPFDQIHVWPRDRTAIGRFGFEPGVDEVAAAVSREIYQHLGADWLKCDAPNRIAEPGERVLDIVLVQPSDWFFGEHIASTWNTRWPGAIQPIKPKYEPISRAYYKAAESIQWSGFDMQPNDLVVEIGSAPGGACGRLLELGFRVIGIDPAEMDPRIAKHPKYRHIRARAGDLPRKEYRGAKWLMVDSNVKPLKTLMTVGNIVSHRQCTLEGLLLTLKLGDYESVDMIEQWIEIVESWDVKEIRIRQLARNRCEVCFAIRV